MPVLVEDNHGGLSLQTRKPSLPGRQTILLQSVLILKWVNNSTNRALDLKEEEDSSGEGESRRVVVR